MGKGIRRSPAQTTRKRAHLSRAPLPLGCYGKPSDVPPNRAPEHAALLLLSRKGDFCQASVKTKLVGIKALSSTSNERRFSTATTRTSPQRGWYPLKTWSHEPGPRSMACSLHSQGKFWADPSPIPSPNPSPRLEVGIPEPGSPALIPDPKCLLCLQPSSRSPGM